MSIKVGGIVVIDDSKVISNLGSALAVSQGGTGLIAPGNSGNVLTSNGSAFYSAAPAATGGSFATITPISANTNAVKNTMYVITANSTLTLPATPTSADIVGVTNLTGYVSSVVARNGSNIMGLAEDMTIDVADASFTMVYANSSIGWVVT